MNIGVYGGTFDPPHLGHAWAAKAAAECLGLDKLLLIPAKTPPHKSLSQQSASPEERLEMTAIMADGLLMEERAQADDLELRREGKSYTADTLRALKERYPDDRLWLLVGTDMFLSLQDWREPEVILSLAGVAAFSRNEDDRAQVLEAQAQSLRDRFGATVVLVPLPRVREVSSTQIRRELTEGQKPGGLSDPVYGYILRKGLYGVHADLKNLTDDQLRACSLSMVCARRHAHILGVEETAVKLAQRWGADPGDARRAGILHDCTKYLSGREQISLCDRAGLELDTLERENPKLLHAKTGAIQARKLYGQNDAVCSAIFWHTTGRGDMSLLEKILYVADYMEPNRDFEGVERMRELAFTDLDEALRMGLEMSVDDLIRRGLVIHHDTQEALDWLKEHRKGI